MRDALIAAAKRGVDVRMTHNITSSSFSTNREYGVIDSRATRLPRTMLNRTAS